MNLKNYFRKQYEEFHKEITETSKELEKNESVLKNTTFFKFLSRHKIASYIWVALMALLAFLFVVFIFSWESLLSWIMSGGQSDRNWLIFDVIFALAAIAFAIIVAVFISKKK